MRERKTYSTLLACFLKRGKVGLFFNIVSEKQGVFFLSLLYNERTAGLLTEQGLLVSN